MGTGKNTPSAGQRRAMEAGDRNLLVSAAAGSGKTYTLVERIVRNIVAGKYRVDELMVVTFTNAAAAEMRERIEKKLMAEVAEHPELARQLVLLPGASISTMHSFCQRLVRENFTAIDIDPKFRIVSDQERVLIRQRVIEELFEAQYETQDEDFLRFARVYGTDRNDEALYEMVLDLYDFAESQADPAAWLSKTAALFSLSDGKTMEDTVWYAEMTKRIRRTLDACAAAAAYYAEMAARDALPAYADAFGSDMALVARLSGASQSGNWEAMREAFSAPTTYPELRQRDAKVDEKTKKFYTDGRDREIKKPLADLVKTYFTEDAEAVLDDLRATGAEAATICRLAQEFAKAFSEAKRKKALLDFDDLEHYALMILTQDNVVEELKCRYKEIMVDEYQDTNGVQEAILQRITNGRNLFMVGDVKQSIYRFRLADPSLFTEKREAYRRGDASGECVELGENYRSRPEVLAAVNFLFSQLMVYPETELSYDRSAALYARADYPENLEGKSFAGAPTELLLVQGGGAKGVDELQGMEAEAEIVAGKLRAMMDDGFMVYDKDEAGYRPLRWRDVAILLRAKDRGPTLIEKLRAYDIPAYAETDVGYFEAKEVSFVLALLAVIDNAHQDIPLAAVLHSMIGEMTAEELARIRASADENDDFYEALVRVAEGAASGEPGDADLRETGRKAARFLERLSDWRSLSRRVGVPELLWQLYRDTGYYDYVGAQPGGLVRQANLRMLVDRAADYEKTNFRGLFRFLKFIRQMKARDTDLSVARTLGEKEDVVRIMTVHKSKGLEFPVVILVDLAKGFNTKDEQKSLLIHKDLGLGLFRTQTEGTLAWQYPTLARHAVKARIGDEAKAEELRVLYVALTRAREKLILVGSVKSLEKSAKKWCRYVGREKTALPGYDVLDVDCWLDWIGMALARSKAGAAIRETAGVADLFVPPDYDSDAMGAPKFSIEVVSAPLRAPEEEREGNDAWLECIRTRRPLPVPDDEKHNAALSWQYGFHTNIPAKMTVTEIKRRSEMQEPEALFSASFVRADAGDDVSREFPPPDFLAPEQAHEGGTAFGTLMHDVMQRLSLDGPLDAADVEAQLARFCAAGVLTEEERCAVRVSPIVRFFDSPLGQRMKDAKMCRREQPFSLLISASQVVSDASTEDKIFLQGVIDVFFEDADGRVVLIDYKTDRGARPETIRARYREQIRLYARAVQAVTGRAVDEAYIYRLSDGDAILIPV